MSTPVTPPSSSSPAPNAHTHPAATKENRLFVNLRKQAKFILLGGGLCYWFDTITRIEFALSAVDGWAGPMAVLSLTLMLLSIGFFAALMLLPLRGRDLDYQAWQSDTHLRHLIPSLTLTLSLGFTALLLTLSPLFPISSRLTSTRQRRLRLSLPPSVLLRLNSIGRQAGMSFETRQHWSKLLGKTRLFDLPSRFDGVQVQVKPAWSAALASAVGAYMLVLGLVGLLGMVTTRTSWGPTKSKGERKGKTDKTE